MAVTEKSPVTALSGCGAKRAELLSALGIYTVRDLLRHFPRGYQDRGNVLALEPDNVGQTGAFVLTVASPPTTVRLRGGKTMIKCRAFDGDKSCTLIFFNRNYLKDVLFTGATYRFYGKLSRSRSGFELSPSVIEQVRAEVKLVDLVPVYPLTKGLTQNYVRNLIKVALTEIEKAQNNDPLPLSVREKLSVCGELQGYKYIHFPENAEHIRLGRERFMAEELFLFACSVILSKHGRRKNTPCVFEAEKSKLYDFTAALPFTLTKAQSRVISDIRKDLLVHGSAVHLAQRRHRKLGIH